MSGVNQQRETDAVLTSVKRIVAEELRRDPDVGLVEKLLLTPALRVDAPIKRMPAEPSRANRRHTPSPLEQRIAELERAVGGKPSDWEPDGSEIVDVETPTEFVLEQPEYRLTPSENVGPNTMLAQEVEGALGDHDSFVAPSQNDAELGTSEEDAPHHAAASFEIGEIGEEQLREIVAEMVRSELQGALGEKITRNVRKLVRRELHRALLTRDLD